MEVSTKPGDVQKGNAAKEFNSGWYQDASLTSLTATTTIGEFSLAREEKMLARIVAVAAAVTAVAAVASAIVAWCNL